MRYLLALLVLLPTASDAVPPVPPSKHWDRFTMLVWQYKTDVMKDKALYESLNLRGFHVDRQNGKLQAFAKVYLDAGQSQAVQLTLDMRSLAYFDDAQHAWVAEAGEFELLVGQSSADLPLRTRFSLAAPWTESTQSTG